jgi:Protein of unknown function (DUF2917)
MPDGGRRSRSRDTTTGTKGPLLPPTPGIRSRGMQTARFNGRALLSMAKALAANVRAKFWRFRAETLATRDGPIIFCRLGKGELRAWQCRGREPLALKGIEGACWVTMAADETDYLVAPGVTVLLHGPGLLVVEGIGSGNKVGITSASASSTA